MLIKFFSDSFLIFFIHIPSLINLIEYKFDKSLEVRDSNNVAKGVYSKFNFSRTGTRLNYYKNENAALFEMSINGK